MGFADGSICAGCSRLKDGEHYLRVVLHLQKDGRVKPLYYEDPQDERTFLYMAYCAQWKQNHGYQYQRAA